MSKEEQIIIDGVNVRNCKGIDLNLSPLVKCKFLKFKTSDGGIAGIWCSDHTNCYYKQLARKTQECEELKLKCLGNRNDYLCERQVTKRYHKALDEIEEIAKGMRSIFIEEISITASQLNDRIYQESTARFRQILDIINKARGE